MTITNSIVANAVNVLNASEKDEWEKKIDLIKMKKAWGSVKNAYWSQQEIDSFCKKNNVTDKNSARVIVEKIRKNEKSWLDDMRKERNMGRAVAMSEKAKQCREVADAIAKKFEL